MVYRPEARLRYATPTGYKRIDNTARLERIAARRGLDEIVTQDVMQRAVQRKATIEQQRKAKQKELLQAYNIAATDRAAKSQAKVAELNTQTAGQYQRLEQRRMQDEMNRYQRRVGEGLYGQTNSNFPDAASIRNAAEGRGPSTGSPGSLESYKWGKFNLTTAKGTKGKFIGLLNDLAATGYKINSIGTYSHRNARGSNRLSEHAYGNAIDINPAQNPMGSRLVTDMPKNITQIAARYGLVWGGTWKSKKDAMHFSTTGY